MAANIDDTRPEHDYSPAHKRVDDADIAALLKAAETIDVYVECFANLAKERDELLNDLERVTDERDEARRECCTWQALESGRRKEDIAVTRGWDCFAHTEGASSPDNSREAKQ
jgi:hypothetical protein